MSKYTDPDSDHYRCAYCGNAKDEHALTVDTTGVVVAGAWREGTFVICSAEAANHAPDALTGILSNAVAAQGGLCLTCRQYPALYCGLDCASRGR